MTDPTTAHNTPPPRASAEDWLALERACSLLRLPSSAFARCLIDLRDCFLDELRPRVAALEAAAAAADHVPDAGKMVTPTPVAAPAGGVTEEELAEAMDDINVSRAFSAARNLLNHPRIGPLLSGEGGKRVVLQEDPPLHNKHHLGGFPVLIYSEGYRDGWTAARAEVARQQGEVL